MDKTLSATSCPFSHDFDDQDECEAMIKHLLSKQMGVTREMPLTKVQRLWNGPTFRGSKPILVSFHLYKDKEEILRKNAAYLKVVNFLNFPNMLQDKKPDFCCLESQGTNIYVTEDFSRKIRKHREELLKFAKTLRTRYFKLAFLSRDLKEYPFSEMINLTCFG